MRKRLIAMKTWSLRYVLKAHSPIDRFVIALHSPEDVFRSAFTPPQDSPCPEC